MRPRCEEPKKQRKEGWDQRRPCHIANNTTKKERKEQNKDVDTDSVGGNHNKNMKKQSNNKNDYKKRHRVDEKILYSIKRQKKIKKV